MTGLQIFILSITPIICVFALPVIIVYLVTRGKDSKKSNGQEEKLLRETWDNLNRMENRIENLETILLERERKMKEKL